MKIIFAGPSLPKAFSLPADVTLRGPARQGDIVQAVQDGAKIVGLIDGYFGDTASVWHKEILQALAMGTRVLGAASMGALRAAECAQFGMEPIGLIASLYAYGSLDDDAAVAISHGPAELGYPVTGLPLVDVIATLERMLWRGAISEGERTSLEQAARAIHFADRSLDAFVNVGVIEARRGPVIAAYRKLHISLKSQDAVTLISRVGSASSATDQNSRANFSLARSQASTYLPDQRATVSRSSHATFAHLSRA